MKPENIAKSVIFDIVDKIIEDEWEKIDNRRTAAKLNCSILEKVVL